MNELLRKRIERHLENLSDQQGYQLLDFVEFLESKYSTGSRAPSTLERLAEGVEDAMRVGRVPAVAIRETMNAMDSASRLMQRLSEAGKSAVDELNRSLAAAEGAAPASPTDAGGSPPGADRPPDPAAGESAESEEPPAPA
ncbi:MAG: hypothetical protein OEY20_04335 [Gemmatimonadota bacterium]|nr:hypothetical protein [Gemmatimonadota bacterium]MDH5196456.1 hypothetical protein [Gemmatimonadota bacterium]